MFVLYIHGLYMLCYQNQATQNLVACYVLWEMRGRPLIKNLTGLESTCGKLNWLNSLESEMCRWCHYNSDTGCG